MLGGVFLLPANRGFWTKKSEIFKSRLSAAHVSSISLLSARKTRPPLQVLYRHLSDPRLSPIENLSRHADDVWYRGIAVQRLVRSGIVEGDIGVFAPDL